jgi:hypothetical protein
VLDVLALLCRMKNSLTISANADSILACHQSVTSFDDGISVVIADYGKYVLAVVFLLMTRHAHAHSQASQ